MKPRKERSNVFHSFQELSAIKNRLTGNQNTREEKKDDTAIRNSQYFSKFYWDAPSSDNVNPYIP